MLYEGYKFVVKHEDGDDYLTLFDHRNDMTYSHANEGDYHLEDLSMILDNLVHKADKSYKALRVSDDDVPW